MTQKMLKNTGFFLMMLSIALTPAAGAKVEVPTTTYYETLGVPQNAQDREIRVAYLRLAKTWHSDTRDKLFQKGISTPSEKDYADTFKAVKEAYECLKDGNQRTQYNRFISLKNDLTKDNPGIFAQYSFRNWLGGITPEAYKQTAQRHAAKIQRVVRARKQNKSSATIQQAFRAHTTRQRVQVRRDATKTSRAQTTASAPTRARTAVPFAPSNGMTTIRIKDEHGINQLYILVSLEGKIYWPRTYRTADGRNISATPLIHETRPDDLIPVILSDYDVLAVFKKLLQAGILYYDILDTLRIYKPEGAENKRWVDDKTDDKFREIERLLETAYTHVTQEGTSPEVDLLAVLITNFDNDHRIELANTPVLGTQQVLEQRLRQHAALLSMQKHTAEHFDAQPMELITELTKKLNRIQAYIQQSPTKLLALDADHSMEQVD